MERVLSESIFEVVAGHSRSCQGTTMIKGEAEANKLLLTQDVLSGCVLATVMIPFRRRLHGPESQALGLWAQRVSRACMAPMALKSNKIDLRGQ
eukprot:4611731-Amphidinium_carterae.1